MGFESPATLLWLLAASGPILLHLVALSRLPIRPFGAMKLLRHAVGIRRGKVRVRNALLLTLRVLVIVAAVLAAARPFVSVTGAGRAKGTPTTLVIVLDDSLSMRRKADGQTLFDLAREEARTELEKLGPGDTASLILAGRPVRTPVFDPADDLGKVRKELDQAVPSFSGTEIKKAIETGGIILKHSPLSGRRLLLLSDQARHAWSEPSLPWSEADKIEVKALEVPVSSSWGNHSVNALRIFRAPSIGPMAIRIEAVITHAGPGPEDHVPVSLELDGTEVAGSTIGLLPDGSRTVVFQHVFERPGTYEGVVKVPKDHLEEDDALSFLVSIGRTVRVLVVNGDPVPASYKDEAFYLERALSASRDFTTAVVDVYQAEKAGLDEYDVLFLANVGAMPDPLKAALENVLESGKGLFVTLGDKTRLVEPWIGLLPLKLKGPTEASPQDAPLGVRVPGQKIGPLAGIRSDVTGLEEVKVFRRFVPAEAPQTGLRTLLTYEDGTPALVEADAHGGKVILWTSTVDRDWTDLPIRPGFVVLIHESVRYLTEKRAFLLHDSVTAGDKVRLRIPFFARELEVKGPAGKTWTFSAGPSHEKSQVEFPDTAIPGVYRVWTESRDGRGLLELSDQAFVVRPDPGEWNLEPVPLPHEEPLFRIGRKAASSGRTPLWPYLLLALMLLLVAESFVAGSALSKRTNGT